MKYTCPMCGGPVVVCVEEVREYPVNPTTGRVSKRGKRLHIMGSSARCNGCDEPLVESPDGKLTVNR